MRIYTFSNFVLGLLLFCSTAAMRITNVLRIETGNVLWNFEQLFTEFNFVLK